MNNFSFLTKETTGHSVGIFVNVYTGQVAGQSVSSALGFAHTYVHFAYCFMRKYTEQTPVEAVWAPHCSNE